MAPTREGRSFNYEIVIDGLKQFLRELLHGRRLMAMYPDEVVNTLEYNHRLEHLRRPHPCEGTVTPARSCFFLRKFSGERKVFWVNTETQEINELAFFAKYQGQRQLFCDLEIGQY